MMLSGFWQQELQICCRQIKQVCVCLCVLEIRLFKHAHPFFPSVLEVQSLKECESEKIKIGGEMSLPFFILMDVKVLKWKSEVNLYKCTEAS